MSYFARHDTPTPHYTICDMVVEDGMLLLWQLMTPTHTPLFTCIATHKPVNRAKVSHPRSAFLATHQRLGYTPLSVIRHRSPLLGCLIGTTQTLRAYRATYYFVLLWDTSSEDDSSTAVVSAWLRIVLTPAALVRANGGNIVSWRKHVSSDGSPRIGVHSDS